MSDASAAHSEQDRRPIACLVMRSVLSRYPSSVFQAALLERAGFRVLVCDIDDGGHSATQLPVSVERHVLENVGDLFAGGVERGARVRKMLGRLRFHRGLRSILSKFQPDLVISYDPPAFAAVIRVSRGIRARFIHVWHCHEAAILFSEMGWGTRRDILLAKSRATDPDLVIIPDRERADQLFRGFSFRSKPRIVMNCPLTLTAIPRPELRDFLLEQGHQAAGPIALYCGSVGEGHGIETTIRGMKLWPADSNLVLLGPLGPGFRNKILALAAEAGCADRVLIAGPGAVDRLWALRAGASVALTIMDTDQEIYRYCAGASNKRFEAMAVGVPQVTNEGAGIDDLFVSKGVAIAVSNGDVDGTARAIDSLLRNPSLAGEIGARARDLHLLSYNYEAEFHPVLVQICAAVENRR